MQIGDPWSSTTIRSEMVMTTFMSCSISMMVTPSARILRIRRTSSALSAEFNPAAGSSRSIMRGVVASARAISSSFWSP